MINVTIWNEYRHEKAEEKARILYPDGIHGYIAGFLGKQPDINVRLAALDDPENGLPQSVIDETDVMLWWGHMSHEEVLDTVVQRVTDAVWRGMGFIALHSAHFSKPFRALMGTSCSLKWRDGAKERLWRVNPAHPIARGIPEHFELPNEEMYGEFFDIPNPDSVIFLGWFNGGEVFRSGCAFSRGHGKVFYFQPGHETNPTYHNEYIQRIILNAVRWAKPEGKIGEITCPETPPLES
ncbi:MAG: ThuA domain-containing protein [Clostridiales bacterium]|jgi:trehalose utilization protein|nr:ThuA domain-containing protein [Clostridiales bacterium]